MRSPSKASFSSPRGALLRSALLLAAIGVIGMPNTPVSAQDTVTPIKLYGINYNIRQGPDWDPNRCKSRSQVVSELSLLKQITDRIRILSCTDCLQGPVVLNVAKQLNLQLWFGLWVSEDESIVEQELTCLSQIVDQFEDTVVGVSVGSEAIYREDVAANQSIAYLQSAKQVLSDAGREDLPVAVCEVDDTYVANPELFQATDIVMANSFPFWEQIDVDTAASFLVEDKLSGGWDVATQYGKDFILGETGWASQGSNRRASEASPENQAQYFQDFYCLADRQEDWMYFWFMGFDTPWRLEQSRNNNSVEGSFGIFDANLTLKSNFADLQFSCSGSSEVYGFVLQDVTELAPTVAPSEAANQPSSTTGPTADPVSSPGATCAANAQCNDLGLTGDCCPTIDGVYLICCEDAPTLSPATAASLIPREVPTISPAPSPGDGTTTTAAPSSSIPDVTVAPTAPLAPTAAPTPAPQDDQQGVTAPSASDAPSDVPSRVPSAVDGNADDSLTSRPTFVVDSGTPPSPFDSTRDGSTSGAASATRTTAVVTLLLLAAGALWQL